MSRTAWTLIVALLASGCSRLPDHAVAHDSPEAREMAQAGGEIVTFAMPQDTPPDLVREYRFAHGDRMTVEVFGHTGTKRERVIVDADGYIHYLMLRNVQALGRSVAEVRRSVEEGLAEFFRNPIVILRPDRVEGSRCYVFGQVHEQGLVRFDRRLRVLDVLAEAGGTAIGVEEGRVREVVDLRRSFLLREGEFLPIDFAALIRKGDLRYNVQIHPGDLLYFADLNKSRVYIFGAVQLPGVRPYNADMTVAEAIAKGGGFHERANHRQVVVVRGNLNRPRVFTVDFARLLSARSPNFQLEPGDIVYVPDRPFHYVRELALLGVRAFIGAVAGNAAADLVGEFRFEPSSPN